MVVEVLKDSVGFRLSRTTCATRKQASLMVGWFGLATVYGVKARELNRSSACPCNPAIYDTGRAWGNSACCPRGRAIMQLPGHPAGTLLQGCSAVRTSRCLVSVWEEFIASAGKQNLVYTLLHVVNQTAAEVGRPILTRPGRRVSQVSYSRVG